MSLPPFDLQAYEPPLSLWNLVMQYVPEHEQEEIKNMLGESLVDQSLELHSEIDTLLDIWRDYRDETESTPHVKLPEPPGLRDRLIQEIQFFVENVKEKARNQGVNADKILKTRHNMDIIEYAVEGSRPGTARGQPRPGTAMSRDGKETPMVTTPTGSDRMSIGSTLSEEIESMNDKLNFIKFDEVVQHLRKTLEEEIETLHRDIRFLYDCLDEEADYRAESEGTITREPTISELQQERSRMEKELLSDDMKTQTSPPLTKPAFDTPIMNRTAPMKAVHSLQSHVLENNNETRSRQTNTSKTNSTPTNSPVGIVKLGQKSDVSGKTSKVVMVSMSSGDSVTKDSTLMPSPPSSAKPPVVRPSSAERFRRMSEEKKALIVTEGVISDDSLATWRKICFAVGGAPYQTTNTIINFFLNIFLLEVAELPPAYVSIIVFGGKVWDAVTDPLCGYLVSRTETKLGKLRPWLDTFLESVCMWVVLLNVCLHVPYTSLTMYITNNQKERDSCNRISEAIGVIFGAVVQGQIVDKYRIADDCNADPNVTPSPQQIYDQKWSYSDSAYIMIGFYMFCVITVFFGTKEKKGVVEDDHKGFFSGVKMVLLFPPYVKLSVSFLFLSLAIAIVQGNLALYCTHSLNLGDYFSEFIIVLLVTTIVAMPVWQMLLVRFGKKSTFAAGMILFIPPLLSQLYIQSEIYIFYIILIIAGFSVSVALSMLPDVLDEFMLQTGTRKDAIFYSFYVFFNKLAAGLGLGLSTLALEFGGYETGKCQQPASVGLALRCLVVPGPVVFVLIALIMLWKYPIDETRRKQIREALAERLVLLLWLIMKTRDRSRSIEIYIKSCVLVLQAKHDEDRQKKEEKEQDIPQPFSKKTVYNINGNTKKLNVSQSIWKKNCKIENFYYSIINSIVAAKAMIGPSKEEKIIINYY
ncbi:hypothetical protein KUTeg_016697 [Tegillarca granosa]|uniref:Uncharacterized protein n=1 Tax=Tegillarca granosa TaxID=220873 RepID=A0ABQ9EQE9_TEGGR|nr:hypothetical protein KUTeg_016697 [Tegillarca granosa]